MTYRGVWILNELFFLVHAHTLNFVWATVSNVSENINKKVNNCIAWNLFEYVVQIMKQNGYDNLNKIVYISFFGQNVIRYFELYIIGLFDKSNFYLFLP